MHGPEQDRRPISPRLCAANLDFGVRWQCSAAAAAISCAALEPCPRTATARWSCRGSTSRTSPGSATAQSSLPCARSPNPRLLLHTARDYIISVQSGDGHNREGAVEAAPRTGCSMGLHRAGERGKSTAWALGITMAFDNNSGGRSPPSVAIYNPRDGMQS